MTGSTRAGSPSRDARDNFYAAARHGLDAELAWPGAGRIGARSLLLDELLTEAHEGLAAFGIDAGERERFLGVDRGRVRSGQTGAAWQRAALGKFGDLRTMMAAYCEGQRSGVPVHEWEL